jgi:hypothetical protein
VSDAALVTWIEQDREAATVTELARRFTALVRGIGASRKADPDAALAKLEAWFANAYPSGRGRLARAQ